VHEVPRPFGNNAYQPQTSFTGHLLFFPIQKGAKQSHDALWENPRQLQNSWPWVWNVHWEMPAQGQAGDTAVQKVAEGVSRPLCSQHTMSPMSMHTCHLISAFTASPWLLGQSAHCSLSCGNLVLGPQGRTLRKDFLALCQQQNEVLPPQAPEALR
jgi:hypothetical protein